MGTALDPQLASTPRESTAPVSRSIPLNTNYSLDQLEDGPLYRAVTLAYELRLTRLRQQLKVLKKSTQSTLVALTETHNQISLLDQSLSSTLVTLAAASSSALAVGGSFESSMLEQRRDSALERTRQIHSCGELAGRLQGACDRLKELDGRKRAFKSESKVYYDGVGKVSTFDSHSRIQLSNSTQFLATISTNASKEGLLDSKQVERTTNFAVARINFMSFLEGLVESEEAAVADWLAEWAGITSPSITREGALLARRKSVEEQKNEIELKMTNVESLPTVKEGDGSGVSDSGMVSDASVSGGSGFSQKEEKNKRRASMPATLPPLEKENRRDRIKGFMKTAQNSFQSALPHTSSPQSVASPSVQLLPPSPTTKLPRPPLSKHQLASAARKKEGFLWATRTSTEHSQSGDGGGSWHKFWTVLANGQLIEFTNWRTTLSIRNAPINLRFASARLSKNSDRRFCFEVLTPKERRIYQTVSEADCQAWVEAISRSVESLLNGTSSVRHFDASMLRGESPSAPSALGRSPGWLGPPLSRRASLGVGKKKEKEEPLFAARPTEDHIRTTSNHTESSMGSSLGLSNSISAEEVGGFEVGTTDPDALITQLVNNWAGSQSASEESVLAKKICNWKEIHRLAEAEGNSTCADCGAAGQSLHSL